jgi:hypothetical protein
LRDELDTDWVKIWCKAANKKKSIKKELTLEFIEPREATQELTKIHSKKIR